MAGERTIRIKFDGSAKGLHKAALDGERALSRWGRRAERVEAAMSRLDFTKMFGKGLGTALNSASSMLGTFAKNAMNTMSSMSSSIAASIGTAVTGGAAMTAATGGINLLVGALMALVAAGAAAASAMIALAPVVFIAGGAFGAVATAAVGLGATMAVLKFGLGGISDALGEIGKEGKVSDETLKKLSPNARLLVKEFARLQKPFNSLRRFVQDKLLVSMNLEVRALAKRWLPALKPMLGDLASRFNLLGKRVSVALGRPDFIKNIRTAVGGFGDFVDRIGKSIPSLIGAFGRLAKASVPFLKELGDMIGGVIEKFSAWITTADKTGKLDTFMKGAAQALRDVWNIAGLVASIVGEVVQILFPGSKRTSGDFLGGVTSFLTQIRDWLADPANQKKIQDWIDKVQDFVEKAATEWIPKTAEWITKVGGWVTKVEDWGKKITEIKDSITQAWTDLKTSTEEKWNGIVTFFQTLPDRIIGFLQSLPGRVASTFAQMTIQSANNVGRMIGNVIGLLITLPGRAASVVSTLPGRVAAVLSTLPGRVSAVFSSARSSAVSVSTSMISRAVSIIGGLPGRARSALGNLGGVLLAAGRALISGLIQGIKDQVPSLTGTLNWVTSKIPDWKGPQSTDKRLLLPAGHAIMGGLMRGIDAEVPALRGQLRGLTTAIGSRSYLTATAGGGATRTTPAPTPQPVFNPEMRVYIGDQELRGMVRVEVQQRDRDLKRRVAAGAGTNR